MENKIGKMIENQREKKNVIIADLCRGICTESVVVRMESGEQMPGYVLMERLFSRLGKSVNKVELLFREEDFREYGLRCAVEEAIDDKAYEEAEGLLKEYEQADTAYQILRDQYILTMRAVLMIESQDSNHEEIVGMLEECIGMTLPDVPLYALDQYCISEEELTLLLMWLEERIFAGETNVHYDCYSVLNYLLRHILDEEILINLYPKAVWIYLESIRPLHQIQEEGKYIEKVIQLLIDNGILIFLPQYLERKLEYLNQTGELLAAEELNKQVNALKWVYESYHQPYPNERIRIWKNYRQKKLYLMTELIKQERKSLRISQEQLADRADLNQKTLSRIETGIHSPKPATYRKLQKALQIERDRYTTVLDVDQFELLERERDLSRELYLNHYSHVEAILKELRHEVDMTIPKNRQYITCVEIKLKVLTGEVEMPEAIDKLISAFRLTREYELKSFSKVTLSLTEVSIVIYIAILYRKLNQVDKAILVCESMLQGFDHSRVDERYHYKEISVILSGLQCYCEEAGNFQKAIHYSDRAVLLEMKCKRAHDLGQLLMQKNYVLERKGIDISICKMQYKKVYQLLALSGRIELMLVLEDHYLEKFDEKISD